MPNVAASNLPNPQSYDTTDPDVVFDRITRLSWQRLVSPKNYAQDGAVGYCADLRLAGHQDWRAPTLIELASIADPTRADPAIDPSAFPDTPPAPFWSSELDATKTGLRGWYVFFKTGGAYVGNDVGDPQRIRCVRGHTSCTDLEVSPYAPAGDAVRDKFTGLTWQRAAPHDTYRWPDASVYCARLDSNGTGWRLPSLRELLTLVDTSRVDPAIDVSAFPNTPIEFFWSSSASGAAPETAWGVNFTRGSSGAAHKSTTAHVRCTR
ncbi:MAG: DUF1566 domain-containing protein [Polyangiaceae bacterium]|jgi:hypothetical protein